MSLGRLQLISCFASGRVGKKSGHPEKKGKVRFQKVRFQKNSACGGLSSITYYSRNFGNTLCYKCGDDLSSETDRLKLYNEKKKQFSTVYPTCEACGDFKCSRPRKQAVKKRPAAGGFMPPMKRSRKWGEGDFDEGWVIHLEVMPEQCRSFYFVIVSINFIAETLFFSGRRRIPKPYLFLSRIQEKVNNWTRNRKSITTFCIIKSTITNGILLFRISNLTFFQNLERKGLIPKPTFFSRRLRRPILQPYLFSFGAPSAPNPQNLPF